MVLKICIGLLVIEMFCCHPLFANDDLSLRIKNKTDQEITLLITASKKYIFANIKAGDVSEYQYLDISYHDPLIELLPGERRISGKTIIIDSHLIFPFETGYYTYIISERAGVFSILCEKDATLEDVGRASSHLSSEEIPLLGNEFLIVDGIKKPGKYHLEPDAKLTLADAIMLAGGAMDGNWEDTAVADLDRIHLMRYVNGKVENYRLDASKRKGVGGKDCNFLIKTGDKIIVPVYLN